MDSTGLQHDHSRRKLRDAKRHWNWAPALVVVGVAALGLGAGYLGLRRNDPRGEFRLRADGLRVSGAGRHDASHVIDSAYFANSRARETYAIAHRIPGTMNQLYCWCHCQESIGMRSLLECFEGLHGASCHTCMTEAEIAWRLTREGRGDPATIQAAVDAWARGP